MYPLKSQRTGQALTTDLTDYANHAEDHRRQRTVGSRVAVLARTFLQRRSLKRGHIHHDRAIPFMAMHAPARQPLNLLLP